MRSGTDSGSLELTHTELDFLELMAKGFDPVDASRSLGISFSRGAQIRRRLLDKLKAHDDNQLRHIIAAIARKLPIDRFAVLENC